MWQALYDGVAVVVCVCHGVSYQQIPCEDATQLMQLTGVVCGTELHHVAYSFITMNMTTTVVYFDHRLCK